MYLNGPKLTWENPMGKENVLYICDIHYENSHVSPLSTLKAISFGQMCPSVCNMLKWLVTERNLVNQTQTHVTIDRLYVHLVPCVFLFCCALILYSSWIVCIVVMFVSLDLLSDTLGNVKSIVCFVRLVELEKSIYLHIRSSERKNFNVSIAVRNRVTAKSVCPHSLNVYGIFFFLFFCGIFVYIGKSIKSLTCKWLWIGILLTIWQ